MSNFISSWSLGTSESSLLESFESFTPTLDDYDYLKSPTTMFVWWPILPCLRQQLLRDSGFSLIGGNPVIVCACCTRNLLQVRVLPLALSLLWATTTTCVRRARPAL
jgi:hypothetical protein